MNWLVSQVSGQKISKIIALVFKWGQSQMSLLNWVGWIDCIAGSKHCKGRVGHMHL